MNAVKLNQISEPLLMTYDSIKLVRLCVFSLTFLTNVTVALQAENVYPISAGHLRSLEHLQYVHGR